MDAVVRFPDARGKGHLHFTRPEFNKLLALYSKRVMTGEWRDYALSFGPAMANFFVFRHSFETPMFVISKLDLRGRGRNGRFMISSRGQKLHEGHDFEAALAIFDRPLRLITG